MLKIDGTFHTINYPSQDQIDGASAVYLGGHIYDITDDEAEALVDAGYEVEEV